MYYIYFSYVAIAASLMLYECNTKNQPKWWALMVLFAPVTAPWFIFKSRKKSGIILFILFLISFSVVGACELFLYSNYMEKNRYLHLPPVARQMIQISKELKMSTAKLDKAIDNLEGLSKVESRIHEIKKTIDFIAEFREIVAQNQDAINRLVKYTNDYKSFFNKKDLNWVFNVQKFYNNRVVVQHYKSLEKYLDDFETLLRYTYVNFYNITEHKSKEHLQNYDQYYLRYRRSVDSHDKFNAKRISFQNSFLKKYPDIKPYLPEERKGKLLFGINLPGPLNVWL